MAKAKFALNTKGYHIEALYVLKYSVSNGSLVCVERESGNKQSIRLKHVVSIVPDKGGAKILFRKIVVTAGLKLLSNYKPSKIDGFCKVVAFDGTEIIVNRRLHTIQKIKD